MNNQILHKDYTSFGGSFQVSLPLNFEFQIERDDPVRLLRHCIHQMDLTDISEDHIQEVFDELNKRPRKCLGYRTPYEVFYKKKLHLT